MVKRKTLFVFCCLILSGISCVNTKNAIYFNDIPDTVIKSTVENLEPVLRKNDLLSISVTSLNSEASIIFNTPNLSATQAVTATGNGIVASGYLVDQDGFIQFPMLGNIKAEGLTKKELKETIAKSLTDKKLLVDPIVVVRYLNFKVTVLGEVNRATVINVPNEKITLLEALGLAGDMTIYAKRDNVMIIREESGNKIIKRLNLNSRDLFTSPYYNLKSNDIVYVEPNASKVASTGRGQQLLPTIFSALSLAVSLAYIVLRR